MKCTKILFAPDFLPKQIPSFTVEAKVTGISSVKVLLSFCIMQIQQYMLDNFGAWQGKRPLLINLGNSLEISLSIRQAPDLSDSTSSPGFAITSSAQPCKHACKAPHLVLSQEAWNAILAIPQPFQSEWLGFQRSKWDCLTIPSIPDTSLIHIHINKPNLSCKNPKLLLLLCLFFKPQTESAGHGRLKLLCKLHPKREAVTAKEILLRLWLDDWGRLDSGVTVPKCDCCAVEQLFLFKPCEGSL